MRNAGEMLRQRISEEIRRCGPIPFSRYMEMCLYEPELGYYQRPEEKFGKDGDFYTSSDVHAVFGRLLAMQFEEMWRVMGSPQPFEIVELGPGRGLFARDVLDWLAAHYPAFYGAVRYSLVEVSTTLRIKLGERLAEHVSRGKAQVRASLDFVLENPSIVFCNEFFDALPVQLVTPEGEVRVEIREEIGSEPRFNEVIVPASSAALQYLDRFSVLPEAGERLEAGLAAQHRIKDIAAAMQSGFLVVIDYGYLREEQLRGRHRGSLVCSRRHTLSESPYDLPGEQDITSHVNFTALQAAAGMHLRGLVTQAQFLLGIGEADEFASVFQHATLPQERAKMGLQLKHLIAPEGMGETFQVMVLEKGLSGVEAKQLSGLRFYRELSARA